MSESQRRKRLHEEARKVTEEATARGLLIEAGFEGLRLMAFPSAPIDQVVFARQAFFAGAQHLLASIQTILDPGDEPTEADLRRMAQISDELERFRIEFEKSLPTAGNA